MPVALRAARCIVAMSASERGESPGSSFFLTRRGGPRRTPLAGERLSELIERAVERSLRQARTPNRVVPGETPQLGPRVASRDWASSDDEARPVDRLAHRLRQVNGQQRNSEAGGNRAEIAQIRVGTRPATMTDCDLGARPAAHRELVTHPGGLGTDADGRPKAHAAFESFARRARYVEHSHRAESKQSTHQSP